MKICVQGLWHLGTVTAACLASAGHEVTGLDFDSATVDRLRQCLLPVFEPGLEHLLRDGLEAGRLSFTTNPQAVAGIDLLWIAYDTPVDADDRADVSYVIENAKRTLPHLTGRVVVLISSQLPAGSTRILEIAFTKSGSTANATFAYSPENLRLGSAIAAFTRPDRVIAGIRDNRDRAVFGELLGAFAGRIEFMSVESAEMTKHALNAFLATSVSFINEIATLCEHVGADAKEVERGLKSEPRIGPKAYLSPGGAFAGGTLARDVEFLASLGKQHNVPTDLLSGVRISNNRHKLWARVKLVAILGELAGRTIAIWGLTYKPGTDTLRRSGAVELCEWLHENGARVQAHDPAVRTLPAHLADKLVLYDAPLAALREAAALIVATEWPDYAGIAAETIVAAMPSGVVLDANRRVSADIEHHPGIRYFTVGKP